MSDILTFYSGSADKKPGKGVGEQVRNPDAYALLSTIPDWRRVLSNFHFCPFRWEGATYNTIEHAFQAAKIALVDPVKARQFTVESGTALGRGDGKAAQKARRLVVLGAQQLQLWDALSAYVMATLQTQKFAACPEARRVLRATGNAQLWHLMRQRGQPSRLVRFAHLEDIRNQNRTPNRNR